MKEYSNHIVISFCVGMFLVLLVTGSALAQTNQSSQQQGNETGNQSSGGGQQQQQQQQGNETGNQSSQNPIEQIGETISDAFGGN